MHVWVRAGGREGRREWEGEREGEKYDDFVILTVDVASIYMYMHCSFQNKLLSY